MTAAALLFDPATAPAPTSSPVLPPPEAPVGDFANLMEGRLAPRFQQGQGAETSAESASAEDLAVDADLVLCHRPSLLPVAPEAVVGPLEGVSETEDELALLPLPETQVETLPPPPEGVPVELIAGCWVWPVPVQPMPETAPASTATPSEGATPNPWPKEAAAPMARPTAATAVPLARQAASTSEARLTPTPPSPAAPVPPSPLANPASVALDTTQWQAVAETLPQPQGPERPVVAGKAADSANAPMASSELVAAVASVLEEAVEGNGDGNLGDPGPGNPSRQGQELPDRRGATGSLEPKPESGNAVKAGIHGVSPSGISTARELNRMNTASQTVETAEPKDKSMSAFVPFSAPQRAMTEVADLSAQWHPNGLPAAFVAISQAQDVDAVQGVDQVRQIERIEAAERLKAVVSHEVQVLKSAGAGSLAVMLRPNADTELFVQLTRHGDRIEAFVRVEKGDSAEFRQGWERLQASLATQQVKLLPLQSSDFQQQPQRQSAQHEGHDFNEPRGGFRDGPGFGREQRGDRGPREERSPLSIETHDRKPSRSIHSRRAVGVNGRTLETWA